MRENDQSIPELPDERNPVLFVFPVCTIISLVMFILWLLIKLPTRYPIVVSNDFILLHIFTSNNVNLQHNNRQFFFQPLLGNALGGIIIFFCGIYAMHRADVHIDINQISDEQLLTHPIFVHNFTLCMMSVFGMILYTIPAWILYDTYKWVRYIKIYYINQLNIFYVIKDIF